MAFTGTISAFAHQVTDVIIQVLGGMYGCTFKVDRDMRERLAKGIELNLRDGCQFTNDDLILILKPDGNKPGALAMHGSRRIQQGIERILKNARRVPLSRDQQALVEKPDQQVQGSEMLDHGAGQIRCSEGNSTPVVEGHTGAVAQAGHPPVPVLSQTSEIVHPVANEGSEVRQRSIPMRGGPPVLLSDGVTWVEYKPFPNGHWIREHTRRDRHGKVLEKWSIPE